MARKKNKQRKDAPDGGDATPSASIGASLGPGVDGPVPPSRKDAVTTTSATNTNISYNTASAGSSSSSNLAAASGPKPRAVAPALPQPPASPALIICRNKSVMPLCSPLSHLQAALDISHRAPAHPRRNKATFSPLRGALP